MELIAKCRLEIAKCKVKRRALSTTVALLLSGCTVAKIDRPVVADMGGNDQQIDFWHELATKPVACNDDAFHGLLLELDGEDRNADYAGRVAALKARDLIPRSFNRPANEGVRRGTVAYALVQALQIKGGLVMTIFGPSERYAVRELRYIDLLPPSSPNQGLSGTEFVGVIGRFEDYQRGNPADLPASMMPPETSAAPPPPAVPTPSPSGSGAHRAGGPTANQSP